MADKQLGEAAIAAKKEKEKARLVAYRAANPEKVNAAAAKYRAANPEKTRAANAKYRAAKKLEREVVVKIDVSETELTTDTATRKG